MESFYKTESLPLRDIGVSCDYDKIFKHKMLFVTGCPRSGTTLLGKIVGSLKPSFYLFEPVILRMLPVLYEYNPFHKKQLADLLKSLLFEDFFLNLIHGRYVNHNELDDSYIGNYENIEDVKKRWSKFRRRSDVIDYLNANNVLFVIKVPELQLILPAIKDIFPDSLFVCTIRNGKDMVSSCINRKGWISNKFFNEEITEWVCKGDSGICNTLWYMDEETKRKFEQWNVFTRAAYMWRVQNEKGLQFCAENEESCMEFKYEDFVLSPDDYVTKITDSVKEKFRINIYVADITKKHIASIKEYDNQNYPPILDQIEEPEKSKFNALMEKLGYRT